ncbi:hypothetical protein HY989_00060 [Candidatus Micrarchaeota archaeon]|nr:hypothetical protein [Candidatus Micrarchaeota archaeon]
MENGKEIEELKEETRSKNLEVRKMADENQKKIQMLKELLDKADTERKARDEYNSKVKEAVDKRRHLIDKAREVDLQLKELEAEGSKYVVPEGSMPIGRLNHLIDQLEWQLQTSAMPIKQENALSKEIKELLKQKIALEKTQPLRRKLYELRKSRQELNNEFRSLDGIQEVNSKESDSRHETMLKYYKKADEIRVEISDYLEKIGEKRKDADETYSKLRDVRNEIQTEGDRVYAEERRERKKKEDEKLDELEEKAKQIYLDFKSGKKVSMEELQIMQMAGFEI